MARSKYTLRVAGLEFTGRTKADAEAARDAWIARTVDGWDSPAAFVAAGRQWIVFPDLGGGWSYRMEPVDGADGHGCTSTCGDAATRREALARARRHAAQNVYDPGTDNVDAAVAVLAPGDLDGERDLRSWCGWQRRYRLWSDAGHPDPRAMADAGKDPADPCTHTAGICDRLACDRDESRSVAS